MNQPFDLLPTQQVECLFAVLVPADREPLRFCPNQTDTKLGFTIIQPKHEAELSYSFTRNHPPKSAERELDINLMACDENIQFLPTRQLQVVSENDLNLGANVGLFGLL